MIKLFFTTILLLLCIPCFAQAKEAEEGLVIHYTFEEGSGSTLRDHSDNKLHGKIKGAKWVKGDFGTALDFDGKDDFIECPYSEATDTPDSFSVEAWVYSRDYGGGIFCRVLGSKWTDERLVLATFYRAEKTPSCVFCISDGAKYDVIQPQTPEIKKWTHLAATFDGEIMKLYRNGTLEKSRAARCKANVKNVPIWIGRSQGIGSKPYFNGLISDVRYYNRAISTAEIKDHYESGIECKGPYNF